MDILSNIISVLIILFFGAVIGISTRYYLTKKVTGKIVDGLLISNMLGIIIAVLIYGSLPILTSGLCGSMTSFSSFIKNSSNSNKYLLLHLLIYTLLSTFLFFIF